MAYSPHPFNVTNWTVFLVALYQTKVSLALGNPHERRQRSCNSKEKLLQPWSDLLEFLRRSPPNKPLMFVWNWVDIHEIRCFLFGNLLWNSGKARHDACGKTKGLKKYSLRFCVCVCVFFRMIYHGILRTNVTWKTNPCNIVQYLATSTYTPSCVMESP